MPETLTVEQVSLALQVSPASVYRLVSRGILPRLPGLRCIRVPRGGLDEYLQGRRGLALYGISCSMPGIESAKGMDVDKIVMESSELFRQ